MIDIKIIAKIKGPIDEDNHNEKTLEILEAEVKLACAKAGLELLNFDVRHYYDSRYDNFLGAEDD